MFKRIFKKSSTAAQAPTPQYVSPADAIDVWLAKRAPEVDPVLKELHETTLAESETADIHEGNDAYIIDTEIVEEIIDQA